MSEYGSNEQLVPPEGPIRILHINSILGDGGTDAQCLYSADALRKVGQDVFMAGPDNRPSSRRCEDFGIPLFSIQREGPLKLAFITSAARIIRSHDIQVVHGHHGRDYWRTVLAAHLSGIRPKIVLHRYLAKGLGTWVSRQFLLNRTDAFVCTSECVAQILREGLYEPSSPERERWCRPPARGDHTRIRVIHGVVDTEKFQSQDASPLRKHWQLGPEHFAFGIVGGYPKPRGKGQREFLTAAARLKDRFPLAQFLVIGRGDLADTLRADIKRLALENRARLTPWCTDMPAVMNALDCLVHSQVGTDAFPTVVLEAMACAKPVIATRIDGALEQVVHGETGILLAPEDVPALSDAMASAMTRPALSRQWGAKGRERVCANFSLPLLAQKTLALDRMLLRVSKPTQVTPA